MFIKAVLSLSLNQYPLALTAIFQPDTIFGCGIKRHHSLFPTLSYALRAQYLRNVLDGANYVSPTHNGQDMFTEKQKGACCFGIRSSSLLR